MHQPQSRPPFLFSCAMTQERPATFKCVVVVCGGVYTSGNWTGKHSLLSCALGVIYKAKLRGGDIKQSGGGGL